VILSFKNAILSKKRIDLEIEKIEDLVSSTRRFYKIKQTKKPRP